MKKIFTLAAILMTLSIASFAADRPKKGKISVTSNSNANIFVKIDGQKYNLDRNEFVLNSLKPGNHRVEVYKLERGGFFGGMRTKVLYSNFVNVAPDQMVNLNINRFDDVVIRKSADNFGGRDDKWGNDRGQGNGRDGDYGRRDDNRRGK